MADAIMTIATTGHEVTLTLTTVAITMRLSEETLAEVRRERAELENDDAPGWAKALARFALGSAEKMLNSSIEYPLADITSIADDNGTVVFTYRSQRILAFEDVMIGTQGHRKQALESFSPADAQSFVTKAREVMGR
jgi:hypothetical protein